MNPTVRPWHCKDANKIRIEDGVDVLRDTIDAAVAAADRQPNEPPKDRPELLVSSWLKKDLPPRDFLLGDILCTTSRWMIYGETGVGKTLFSGDMGGAVASGKGKLLNWPVRRQARVMYIDGELPAETFKERIELIARKWGSDIPFYGYTATI